MTDASETRYVEGPDGVTLAYHVWGDGSLDVVVESDLAVPIDLLWDDPNAVRLRRRLSAFSRTIWFEPRGRGASAGAPVIPSWEPETHDADLTVVLDATGCDRAALIAVGDRSPDVIHFAVEHHDRVSTLVLLNAYGHYVREYDYPCGIPVEALDRFVSVTEEQWGTGAGLAIIGPSRSVDEPFRQWWARCERLGFNRSVLIQNLQAAYKRDVRPMLSELRVPTLVLHREGDRYIQLGAGQYLAKHIPGAKFVVLPGDDHMFFLGDVDRLADEIEEFLTGGHQGAEGDVRTATILFTDIASSTERASTLGHRTWTQATDDHDAMVRATLLRHRGTEIKTIGDGFSATFDGTTRAVRAATEIVRAASDLGLEVRAGVHTGEVEVRPDDVIGLPVSIAKRVCDHAAPAQVLLTEVVKLQLAGSDVELEDEGSFDLKGVPGVWTLFSVKH